MKKVIIAFAGLVFRHNPVFYESKREKLSKRLHRVFDMDFIEGSLDRALRRYLVKN